MRPKKKQPTIAQQRIESERLQARHVALVRASKADTELANALMILRPHDTEAAILVKRAISQLRNALDYLR